MTTENFRKARGREMQLLGEVLRREGLCKDPGPLHSAASQCIHGTTKGAASWGYSLVDLRLEVDSDQKGLPTGVSEVSVTLNIDLVGRFVAGETLEDPFEALGVDIIVSGFSVLGPLRQTWHLDRHITGTRDEQNSASGQIHPLYHFHCGGRHMSGLSEKLGGAMLLDAPRLMHPPMDAILAIDFVFANFAGSYWRMLRDDGFYATTINEAYKRFWAPYFKAVSEVWPFGSDSATRPGAPLCPQPIGGEAAM